MEYTVQSLAKLAGVSPRTLRYYDEIQLLTPVRKASTGYRIYSAAQVDKLQQILFYKNLGMDLETIKGIVNNPNFDNIKAMESHLNQLQARQQQLSSLITYVNLTISSLKGEQIMSDSQKFEIFKEEFIENNAAQYGCEVKEKYGEDVFAQSNKKLKNASQQQWQEMEHISAEINTCLAQACQQGDPSSEIAQKTCALHQQWIQFFWPTYTPEAHLGLCQMYVCDERFKAYYEKVTPGGAEFLLQAMEIYLK